MRWAGHGARREEVRHANVVEKSEGKIPLGRKDTTLKTLAHIEDDIRMNLMEIGCV